MFLLVQRHVTRVCRQCLDQANIFESKWEPLGHCVNSATDCPAAHWCPRQAHGVIHSVECLMSSCIILWFKILTLIESNQNTLFWPPLTFVTPVYVISLCFGGPVDVYELSATEEELVKNLISPGSGIIWYRYSLGCNQEATNQLWSFIQMNSYLGKPQDNWIPSQ